MTQHIPTELPIAMTAAQFTAWRETRSWTKTEAAEALDMTRRQIFRYETDQAAIPRTVVMSCALIDLVLGIPEKPEQSEPG